MMLCSGIVLVCSMLVHVTLSTDPPDCAVKYDDPCVGLTVSGNMTTLMLNALCNHFCGCVYVTGAIDIRITLPDIADTTSLIESNFSFFYHIREIHDYLYLENIPQIDRISFPNLRIIRGENLVSLNTFFSDRYSLAVFSSNINNLYMPNLTEITKGRISFKEDKNYTNSTLCNVLTVNWADILVSDDTPEYQLDKCTDQFKPNCSSLGCDYCWCDDKSADQCCQELTRVCHSQCEGRRCHKQIMNGDTVYNCCNSVCAGGCDGVNDTHCRACKLPTVHVLNGDTCEPNCPARFSSTGVKNPDGLFQYQDICVKFCPSDTFELNDTVCVEVCPTGTRSVLSETGGMKCEICDGHYCKECKASTYETLEDSCTVITGSLTINGYYTITSGWWSTSRIYYDDFPKLKSIRVIRGALRIRYLRVQEFPYLSNLEVVGDEYREVGSCIQYDNRLLIYHNDALVSIDLSSLRIITGHVLMYNNPKLCIFGDFSKFVSTGSLPYEQSACLNLHSGYRRSFKECVANNLACHSICDPIDGCWGTTDADCVTCDIINYQYNGRCVPTCEDFSNLGEYLYNNYSTKRCEPCHELCKGSCSGKGPTHCHSCRTGVFRTINNGSGFICLNECSSSEYYAYRPNNSAGMLQCLLCSSSCMEGCVGSLNIIDHSHGCLMCDTLILDRTGNQVMCSDECPDYHYIDDNSTSLLSMYAGQICAPCHENCHECDGPELTDCISCKVGKICNIDTTTSKANSSSTITSTSTVASSTASALGIPTVSLNIVPGTSIGSPITTETSKASSSGTGTSLDWLYFIILPAVAVIVLLVVIAIVGGFYYRKHSQRSPPVGAVPLTTTTTVDRDLTHDTSNLTQLSEQQQQSGLIGIKDISSPFNSSQEQLISSATFKIPPDVHIPHSRITLFESIGQGEFGVVYRASLLGKDNTQTTVAVKTIKGDYTPKELNDLLEESLLMRGINHSNVMGLIGVCNDAGETPFIVLPYMEGGPLLKYLRNNRDSLFISSTETAAKIRQIKMKLTEMCLQIARGMEYLAKLKLIHRDLAARNCMLDSHCNVKVADFGLSKGMYYKAYFRQERNESIKLPVKWLAIESLEYGMFTEKSDVWAYGVTCWEVFSCGKIPYGGVAPSSVLKLLKSDQRMEKLENAACSEEIFQELMVKCWNASPEKRPCFSEIVKCLDKLIPSILDGCSVVTETSRTTYHDGASSNNGLFNQLSVQENDVENQYI